MLDQDKTKEQLIEELVTMRKQAAEAPRLSEAKYRSLHQTMMDAFIRVDMAGFIQECNDAFRTMLGYELEELQKLRYMDVTPEKWNFHVEEIVQSQILSRGYSDIYEKEYRRKDGTIVPIEMRVSLITDDQKQACGMWAIVRDITKRKRAEEALHKAHAELRQRVEETRLNEARLEAVLQLSQMTEASLKELADFAMEQAVALTKSKMGYVAFMNEDETVLTMYSWSKEAMAECAVFDKPIDYPVVTTGLWGEAVRQRRPIVTNDYAASNPLKKGLPEGHVRLCRHMNVPVSDEGRIVVVAGVGNKETDYNESDVRQLTLLMTGMWTLSERNRMQAELRQHRDRLEQLVQERTDALRQSEERYELAVRGVGVGIWDWDIRTGKVYYSPRWKMLFGYDENEIGESVEDWSRLLHPDDRDGIIKFQDDFLAGTSTRVTVEYRLRHKDGSYRWIVANALAVRDEHGKACRLVGSHGDVTDRKQAEEALRKEHRTLKHLLQSSDHERQIIAYEIHDGLAQHLAAAIMQFDAFDHLKVTKPKQATDAYHAALTMLRQGHVEARRLIAGLRPPILDESGVVEAIAHLVNELRREKGPRIEFLNSVEFDRLVPILENSIYRVVQEALTNACKHSKSEKVRVSLLQQNDRVRIEIRDWGAGFDTNAIPTNHFGLEGIRQRARLLGRKCSIRSSPGKGTRIVVELPVVLRDEEG